MATPLTSSHRVVINRKENNPPIRTRKRGVRGLLLLVAALAVQVTSAWATPLIFNSTESAAPGEIIYLQGDNFTATPQVWFHRVLTTDTSLSPDAQLTVLTSSNQAVTAPLPLNMPLGLYAVWVKDTSGVLSAPALINRARATSFEYPQVAPYSQANPAASYTFRIFGRNLVLNGSTPTITFVSGTTSLAATVDTSYPNDGNVLQVVAPSGITAGTTYSVNVSNGAGHSTANYDVSTALQTIQGRAGGADPFNLGVTWASDFTAIAADVINVVTSINPHTSVAYGADPSGATNSVNAIQQALYDAGNPALHPNGATVFLPAGTFLVNFTGENLTFYGPGGTSIAQNMGNTNHYELEIPSRVVLQGAGIGNTVVNDSSPAYNGYTFFITIANAPPNNGSFAGVQGFTYNQNMTVSSGNFPPAIRNCAINSSEIFFDHIQANFAYGVFSSTSTIVYGQFIPQSTSDVNVLVQNCSMSHLRFGNDNYYGFNYTYGSNYIFRDNTFSSWVGRLEFDYMGSVLFENNSLTRDGSFPPPGNTGGLTCGGFQSTGADKTVLNNSYNAINLPLPYENDGESVLSQETVHYDGSTVPNDSGTATSVTISSLTDSTKSWTTNAFSTEILAITGGTGQGEWAEIEKNTATVLTLDRHWVTLPDTTSTYTIGLYNSFLMGVPTGSTSTTVTDSAQTWPTNFHAGDSISILSGPGAGQVATILSNTATTLTVSPPWLEIPGTSSHYSINGTLELGAQRWLVKGNSLREMTRGIALYGGGYDCAIVGNDLASAGGIFVGSSQRTLSFNMVYLGWRNVITDNFVSDPDNDRAGYFALHAVLTINSPLDGILALGNEYRRNVLWSSSPNLFDSSWRCDESFSNIVTQVTSGNAASGVGILDTIYTDNLSINSNNAYEVTTAASQTPLWDSLILNCGNDYLDSILPGAGTASDQTVLGDTAGGRVFGANFSGTGTSTGIGGTGANLVDIGAGGQLVQASGQTASILSTTPFDSGSGSYMRIAWTGTGDSGAGLQSTAISPRFSWARIFDQRTGQWLVNGAFDFFVRPQTTYTTGNELRPIDMGWNIPNGIRLILNTSYATNSLVLSVITPTGGGGNSAITGTYSPGFVGGTVYHIGVTFATDVTQSPPKTTAKVYVVQGTGAIDTTSTSNLIATGTFQLNHSVVNDTNPDDWFNGGPWNFGGGYGPSGVAVTNDFDGLKLYYADPGTFPALDAP